MHRIRVGVLRGGPSNEYEVSLKTGATVLNHLPQDKYNVKDILVDKKGVWHVHGLPVKPHDTLHHFDVIFNALHGHFGEDGKVQHILESHGIPFTGSGSFASAVGMNKNLSKEVYKKRGMKTPQSLLLESLQNISVEAHKVFQKFPLPVIVKPVSSGSSVGVNIVKGFPELEEAIKKAFEHSNSVLIEELIQGKEATCGVIDGFRDHEHYPLPPIEIRPHTSGFFDFDAKYGGLSDEIVPGNFSEAEKKELEKLAIEAHKALGLRHYSRSDFIIHPKRGIFILETNTLPGLTEESLVPKALHSVGASLEHFLDHILQLAISKK
jgi:D-alanine-D-alanine ligase